MIGVQTVLIIEDEAAQREALTGALSAAGYKVIQAVNGVLGLSLATDKQPDLILLDIQMPEMSGFQMLQKLRVSGTWGARVPVIFLTNVQITGDEEREDVANTRPAHYFVKSDTNLSDVVAKVQELIGKAPQTPL